MQQSGFALRFASDEVKNTPEVVRAAVQRNGYALHYASPEVKNNPDVVRAAVQENPFALQYASDEVKNNPEVVRAAVQQDGFALEFASGEVKNNPDVVHAAVQQCRFALQYASAQLRTLFDRIDKYVASGVPPFSAEEFHIIIRHFPDTLEKILRETRQLQESIFGPKMRRRYKDIVNHAIQFFLVHLDKRHVAGRVDVATVPIIHSH